MEADLSKLNRDYDPCFHVHVISLTLPEPFSFPPFLAQCHASDLEGQIRRECATHLVGRLLSYRITRGSCNDAVLSWMARRAGYNLK